MSESLAGQVVLVTGSSRGLGAAIARAFDKAGANVVVNYFRSKRAAEALAHELRNGLAIHADITDSSQVKKLFEVARKHFSSPISVVVNNALVDFNFNGEAKSSIASIRWDEFNDQIRGAVQGALNTTQAALPGFELLGGGRIINIGSNLVQNPVVPYQDYCTAKGALLAFTHSVAAELGPKNITCNMVAGGLLRSTDASSATPQHVFDQIAAVTPLRKVTTPEDMCGAVLFFASSWATAVTGQQIIVDGGLVMT